MLDMARWLEMIDMINAVENVESLWNVLWVKVVEGHDVGSWPALSEFSHLMSSR